MDEQSETDRILRQGGTDDAIGRLNNLIESGTQPRDQLYYRLGNAYRKKGNFREAHQLLSRSHGRQPRQSGHGSPPDAHGHHRILS